MRKFMMLIMVIALGFMVVGCGSSGTTVKEVVEETPKTVTTTTVVTTNTLGAGAVLINTNGDNNSYSFSFVQEETMSESDETASENGENFDCGGGVFLSPDSFQKIADNVCDSNTTESTCTDKVCDSAKEVAISFSRLI